MTFLIKNVIHVVEDNGKNKNEKEKKCITNYPILRDQS